MKYPRTDLAMESFDSTNDSSMPGVQVSQWNTADVRMTEVIIQDPQTAEQLGKPCGAYLTMECGLLREHDPEARMAMAHLEMVTGEAAALSRTDMEACARSFHEHVVPAMEELRSPIDRLEYMVDKSLWPYPSYGDLLFSVK